MGTRQPHGKSKLVLLDLNTGKELSEDPWGDLKGDSVVALAWSPNGEHLIVSRKVKGCVVYAVETPESPSARKLRAEPSLAPAAAPAPSSSAPSR